MVSVSFPMALGGTVILSVADPEVKQAMKVINDSLVAQGFVLDANPDDAGVVGFVASYTRRDKDGLIPPGGQTLIWLKSDRLEIVFGEGRKVTSHVVPAVRQATDRLEADLRIHYGKSRVKVREGAA